MLTNRLDSSVAIPLVSMYVLALVRDVQVVPFVVLLITVAPLARTPVLLLQARYVPPDVKLLALSLDVQVRPSVDDAMDPVVPVSPVAIQIDDPGNQHTLDTVADKVDVLLVHVPVGSVAVMMVPLPPPTTQRPFPYATEERATATPLVR